MRFIFECLFVGVACWLFGVIGAFGAAVICGTYEAGNLEGGAMKAYVIMCAEDGAEAAPAAVAPTSDIARAVLQEIAEEYNADEEHDEPVDRFTDDCWDNDSVSFYIVEVPRTPDPS